ncbi:integrase, catalytic region, zinc finger, CCHC-type containing protein [Tanacetum coccineum]
MELYMQNREHGRMILESVEHGPLIWPTVEENGVTRTKKYVELSATEKIQADCDIKATNFILQGTSLTKQERECKLYDAFDKFTHIKGEMLHNLPPEWSKFVTDVKLVKDLHTTNFNQLHAYLEQHELHANELCLLRERNQYPLLQQQLSPSQAYQYGPFHQPQPYSSMYPSHPQLNHSSVPPSHTYQSQMTHQTSSVPQIAYPSPQVSTQPMTESSLVDSGLAVPVFSPGDDPIACLNKTMAFLTAIASSWFPLTNNQLRTSSNPRNQATIQDGRVTVQQEKAMLAEAQEAGQILDEEQLAFLADPGLPDGQAVQAIISNNAAFQTEDLDTYDSDCDDILNIQAVLMANISNYGSDVISEGKANKEQTNESVTAELERYKERVKTFEQLFKSESKEKEDKYMENEIDLEKKIKELHNILFKVGQSAQTVHMLTMPQAFYDNIHKQALGYQNPFHLKKAQWIKPTLYDGIVMFDKHVVMHVIDDEETLILEEDSRSKMSEKEKDPKAIKQNISHKPTDYENLNKLTEDFGKRFTPEQELSAEQAFWLRMSNPTSKHFDALPVKIKAPKELPKISLVNESLKKLKFHLAKFDNVVKIRTTPNARTEGEWGFEHTKAVFNNEIIPFLKSLKDIFNVFDRDLLNEIMEVQTVFDQMDAVVQQSSVDKQCLEIAKKELLLENDRLLQQIMSQDVLLTVMNSMSLIGDTVNMDGNRKESCNLEAELLKSQNAFNDLLKSHSQLEKHCISLECSIQLNQEIFQKRESCDNQNALEIPEFFENKLSFKTKTVPFGASDSLIDKLNLKSAENKDLKAQIKDKVFVITSLKNDLQKLKGKEIVDIAAQIPSSNTIVPGMFKLDLEPLAPSAKKVAVTPKNKARKVRFVKPLTSSRNIKHVESSNTSDSNTPVLSSTGLKCSTSMYGSKPTGNKRNDRISQTPSRNMKNKVKAQPRKVNKKHRVVEPIRDVYLKHSQLNENSKLICATCNKSMFDGVHDKCLLDFVENVNIRSSKKAKIVESKNANHSEPNHTWGSNATDIPSSSSLVMTGTVRFGNDNIARIMGYGDYQLGNVTISRVYYVDGLGHNLFSVGQFCDGDLEFAFQKNTCFIRNLKGVDLLSGYHDINLYTISLDDMLKTSPVCLLSKASKTKSWLWHRRLSYLNFGTINKLAKDGLSRGIPRLTFQKDHLCFACALGKSKKSSHQPKAEDINQEKLYLLHMDLCGPMRVASINGKSYILVIVEDYSRFTWVRFLKTKDEAPRAIIK